MPARSIMNHESENHLRGKERMSRSAGESHTIGHAHAADVTTQARSALLAACQDGSLTSAKLQALIRKNAYVSTSKTENGDSTLMLAVASGSLDACTTLVTHDARLVNMGSCKSSDYYPLIRASRWDHTEIARLLINHCANVNKRSAHQDTALIYAARNDNTEIARLLLSHRADIDPQNSRGLTALHTAAKEGNMAMVKVLLEMKADTSIVSKSSHTALATAEKYKRYEVMDCLRLYHQERNQGEAKEDESKKDSNSAAMTTGRIVASAEAANTALLTACQDGSLTSAKLQALIEKNAYVSTSKTENGDSTLMLAVASGSLDACTTLVTHDARLVNMGSCKSSDYYPLIRASRLGHIEIARLLINHCADVNKRANNRDTALIHAARNDNTEIARLLLSYRADIDRQSSRGYTALYAAAHKGNVAMVKVLLEMKADTSIVSKSKYTALATAERYSRYEVVNILMAQQLKDDDDNDTNDDSDNDSGKDDGDGDDGGDNKRCSDDTHRTNGNDGDDDDDDDDDDKRDDDESDDHADHADDISAQKRKRTPNSDSDECDDEEGSGDDMRFAQGSSIVGTKRRKTSSANKNSGDRSSHNTHHQRKENDRMTDRLAHSMQQQENLSTRVMQLRRERTRNSGLISHFIQQLEAERKSNHDRMAQITQQHKQGRQNTNDLITKWTKQLASERIQHQREMSKMNTIRAEVAAMKELFLTVFE